MPALTVRPHTVPTSPELLRCVSRLTTTNATARTISGYAIIAEEVMKRGVEVGAERDELKDLCSDLRSLAERYLEDDDWGKGLGEEMDEDEDL